MRFRWPWREYQRRVLDTVDAHLSDGRLHIVAAPGAGKTSLGLEVFRRLARPTLVLAPTLTIRDQWIQRLDDFLGAERTGPPSWASSRLDAPAFFTASTYQALLMRSRADRRRPGGAATKDDDRATSEPTSHDVHTLADHLRRASIGTLILDEAHHLTRAWWRALEEVVAALPDVCLVSLTATPPYDATGHHWQRYERLCGPIDEEVATPELVGAGTLCPHQDFLYAVTPSEQEADAVTGHDARVRRMLAELLDDPQLHSAVDAHPWLVAEPPIEEVLDDPPLAFALLSYARATGSGDTTGLAAALSVVGEPLPPLDLDRWEVLLSARLFGQSFRVLDESGHEASRKSLARRLRGEGLLWRRSLRFATSPEVDRALSRSEAKVQGCVEINAVERAVRGEALRQVYLLDFIRDDGLHEPPGQAVRDLGAFPVFDALRAEDVALLTGRVAAIHESRVPLLGDVVDGARITPLPHRNGWVQISGVTSGELVREISRLLEEGEVRVLVGTRGLLGEGWDAPVVNSVVLASYVGAFVSTNQMRGRGIRSIPDRPDKVSSVWHLVAMQFGSLAGSRDMDLLRARFRGFVGPSADGRAIESGIERLHAPPLEQASDIESFNREFVERLGRLSDVAGAWRGAIESAEVGRVVPTVSFRTAPSVRSVVLKKTLRVVLVELGWASLFAAGSLLRAVTAPVGTAVMIGAALPALFLLPKLVRAGRLALRHLPVDGSVRHIAEAVAEALSEGGLLDDPPIEVHVERDRSGVILVSPNGGSFRDQSVFTNAVLEVFAPIENPRYLISRKPRRNPQGRRDYHAVPVVLGRNKELAEIFHRAWLRRVGFGDLIYTRQEGGRRLLLEARSLSFASRFDEGGRRQERWR